MRKKNTPSSSRHSTSSSPVVSQKDLKSATAPGSVALTSRISPPATPFIALRARSTGSGHLRPVASREVTDKPAIPLFEGVAGPTNNGAPQKNQVPLDRTEERRVGKGGGSKGRSGWVADH